MNSVSVSWQSNRDGAAPEGFYVQVSGPEGFAKTVPVPAPVDGTEVSGLKNGVEYSFTVIAATRDGSAAPSQSVSATPTTGVEGVVAGLIVEFAPGSEKSKGDTDVPGQERVSEVDLVVAEKVSDDAVLVELSEPVDVDTATRIADDLAADEQVTWAEPDQFFFTSSENTSTNRSSEDLAQTVTVPTDSDYASSQWNLWDSFGITIGDGNDSMTDAWAGPRGDGVRVAVIDTGITDHPDLVNQLVPGYDFVSSPEKLAAVRQANAPPVAFDGDYVDEATYGALGRDDNPTDPGDWRGVAPVRDSSWHGTKIAGLIAAEANNDGITGIAPGAKIQPIRALSWRGGLLSDIAASITWASGGTIDGVPVNANPSKVINMSFAVETICPVALQDAIDGAIERGSILVAAAGNASDDASKFAPGNCNGVITVAATNRDGQRADYSNYGETIDVAAPGGDATNPITVTTNTGTQTPNTGTAATTGTDSGTSIAAAHVSAAAAILASRNANLTPDQAYQTLTGKNFTKAFGNDTCDADNPDYTCGTGILSLGEALAKIASACTPSETVHGNFMVVQFTGAGTCTWTRPNGVSEVSVLVVGGGGGGGAVVGGGGGGGGVREQRGVDVSNTNTVPVTVGSGGLGAQRNSDGTRENGASGEPSSFGSIEALGGGVGASWTDYQAAGSGVATGGGGSQQSGTYGGGDGAESDGGSAPNNNQPHSAGGGGGAGGNGANGSGNTSGNGGLGKSSLITGSAVFYGGGGGGSNHGIWSNDTTVSGIGTAGSGGVGGGGDGAAVASVPASTVTGAPGVDGLGGGGGGGANQDSSNANFASFGGKGGDGTVIIRYFSGQIDTCDVGFGELDFDYSTHVKKVGTGFNVGDKILFPGVATKSCDGVVTTIDALVTTSALVNSSITRYEDGARAGGEDSFFQVDTSVTGTGGYAQFTFDFYKSGTYDTVFEESVALANVQVTGIDIDASQFNYFSDFDSYTLASNTRLTVSPVPSSFPATAQFNGPRGAANNDPRDQVVTTYGEVQSFSVRMGNNRVASTNYFGLAFKELGWGSTTPVTTGTDYSITYALNGADSGAVPASQMGGVGEVFAARANTGSMTKVGSTFGGWNTASDGSGTAYAAGGAISMPVNGVTLYAVWIPETYTVTYSANGGSGAPSAQSGGYASSVTVAADGSMARSGYTFTGWNSAANGSGASYAAGDSLSLTGSVTLYAQWAVDTVTVTLDYGSGTGSPASLAGPAGSSLELTTTQSRSGYWFNGWNTVADGSGVAYAAGATIVIPSTGLTLHAQWIADSFTVAYNANGGSGAPAAQSVATDSTVNVSATLPARGGYTFTGWNTVADGSGTARPAGSTFVMPPGNVTLYAQWAADSFSVVYNANGGTGAPVAQTAATDSTVTVSTTTPTRPGYSFTGWNTVANGSGTARPSGSTFVMPGSNVTLYAQWTALSLTVSYDANGGSGAPANQVQLTGSTVTVSSTVPIRNGYTLASWNSQVDGAGSGYLAGNTFTMPTRNVTLFAVWVPNSYAVTYNANGGTGAPGSQTSFTGENVIVSSTIPSRANHSFAGWNTYSDGSGTSYASGDAFPMPASSVSLFAMWNPSVYSITYNANDGSGAPSPESVDYAETATASAAVPTRTNYWFNGWNTSADGSGISHPGGSTFTMLGNLTLYAQWVESTYNLSYNANGGTSAPGPQTHTAGATVTAAAIGSMTRTGYTFSAWAKSTGGTVAAGGTLTMPNSNTTLFAQWQPIDFDVTYNANGGSGTAPETQEDNHYLDEVTVEGPTILSRAGYTFTGWNTAADGSGTGYSAGSLLLMPAANVTLFAQWFANTSAVIYNANGGSDAPVTTFAATGATLNVPSTIPNRPGYTFSAWAKSTGGTVAAGGTLTMPASTVTLTAVWIANSYTLNYSANGGTGAPASSTHNTDSLVVVSTLVPSRNGFLFTGWNTAANGTGVAHVPGGSLTMPAANVTLYAQWQLSATPTSSDGVTTPTSSDAATTPDGPLGPPESVIDGDELVAVLEGGQQVPVETKVLQDPVAFELTGNGFGLLIKTGTHDGSPVPLAGDERLVVPQGGRIQTSGEGFRAASMVRIFIIPLGSAEPVYLGEAEVDSQGRFSSTVLVPLSAQIGDYVLQINGLSASAVVRSVNAGLLVAAGEAPLRPMILQRAGFYEDRKDEFSTRGNRKLRRLISAIPEDASAVQVLIAGVSVSMGTFDENLALAGRRASNLSAKLKSAGVSGEYTVNVTATFTVDAAERALASKVGVLATKAGKPLSTVTVIYQEPVAN